MLAFARFLVGDMNAIALIGALDALIAQVDLQLGISKPSFFYGKLAFKHRVVVVTSRKGLTEEEDELAG